MPFWPRGVVGNLSTRSVTSVLRGIDSDPDTVQANRAGVTRLRPRTCDQCKEPGHIAKNCPNVEPIKCSGPNFRRRTDNRRSIDRQLSEI